MTETIEKSAIKQTRQSNFELLRILAIILIIAHHFAYHGYFYFPVEAVTIPRLWVQFIQMCGKAGVNIFVLITGYFSIKSKQIHVSKVVKLWLQLLFYSLAIYLIFVMSGKVSFDIRAFIKSLLPVTYATWWYASTYIVLYILTPFINRFLQSLDKHTYQVLLLMLFVMWCIIPTFTNKLFESNYLLWFIFIYSLAGYIRLWADTSSKTCGTYCLMALGVVLLSFLSVVFFDILGTKTPYFAAHATHLYELQMLPTLLISVLLFLCFKNIKMRYHKLINCISTLAFGIYLIHDNEYIRGILWTEIFKTPYYANTIMIIPYSLAVICIIFAVCGAIEFIRINLLEKNYMKIITKLSPYFSKKLSALRTKAEKLFSLL